MRWSWFIGKYAGVKVYIHATFLLIIGWIVLIHWMADAGIAKTIEGILFTLAIFLCVLLHEFGHSLAARHFGIRTKNIVLLPIGGVATLEKMPDKPYQELWVAIAGPAVNFVIAILIYFLILTAQVFVQFEHVVIGNALVTGGDFFGRLFFANIFLAVFNLIPAFPMDGGRVFRAVLAMRMEYVKATQTATQVGQGLALLFAFAGLLFNPFLIIIALFIWLGASRENSAIQLQSAVDGIPVYRAMITDFKTLTIEQHLGDAVKMILSGSQQDFPVMDGEKVAGILTRNDLIAGLSKHGQDAPVTMVMQKKFVTAVSTDMLSTAFEQLQACQCRVIPVCENNRLIGLLSAENIGELLMIQDALKKKKDSFSDRI